MTVSWDDSSQLNGKINMFQTTNQDYKFYKWGDELLFRFFWVVAQRKQNLAIRIPTMALEATNLAEHVADSFEKSLKVVQLWPWLLVGIRNSINGVIRCYKYTYNWQSAKTVSGCVHVCAIHSCFFVSMLRKHTPG